MTCCTALKKDGTPCRANFALRGGLCGSHDPARAAVFRAGSLKGVAVRQEKRLIAKTILPDGVLRPPKSLADAVRWASWTMHAVVTGVIDGRTAHEIIFAANSFTASLQKRDLEREIAALRKQLDALKKAPGRGA